jgi:hypothetical protein
MRLIGGEGSDDVSARRVEQLIEEPKDARTYPTAANEAVARQGFDS